ncbi:MAG: hypothetical protein WD830_03115 [Chloroflexota bacterium]
MPAVTRWIAPSILAVVVGVTGPCSSGGQQRPEVSPTGAYEIELSLNGGDFRPVTIGREGEGCERFAGYEDAERTCFIAKELIPSKIGGEAYGELNDRHTPAFDALVWRARADADVSVCDRGGLEGAFLADCTRAAQDPSYIYERGAFRVRVPIGGAVPNPSPSP